MRIKSHVFLVYLINLCYIFFSFEERLKMTHKAKVVIVGATGNVGREMVKVLEERNFPIDSLRLVASDKSAGKVVIPYKKSELLVEALSENTFRGYDIALFSAGGDISRKWAQIASEYGCIVIDNSSAWRMDPSIPLVVPEVNPETIKDYLNKGIIANPNCSTIQMVVALNPLDQIPNRYGIRKIIVSTYQSVSGAGTRAEARLAAGSDEFNIIPQIGDLLDNGNCQEEQKMIDETRKIMGKPQLKIIVTTVRVPVKRGHSENILFEFDHSEMTVKRIKELLEKAPGVRVVDPCPTVKDAVNIDEVLVGKIRNHVEHEGKLPRYCFSMWVVADNIRKGAATNAVQIAEILWHNYLNKKTSIV